MNKALTKLFAEEPQWEYAIIHLNQRNTPIVVRKKYGVLKAVDNWKEDGEQWVELRILEAAFPLAGQNQTVLADQISMFKSKEISSMSFFSNIKDVTEEMQRQQRERMEKMQQAQKEQEQKDAGSGIIVADEDALNEIKKRVPLSKV